MEYIVIKGVDATHLQELVLEKLADGWLPLGGVSCRTWRGQVTWHSELLQAMTREKQQAG